jgi:hypothetical protein
MIEICIAATVTFCLGVAAGLFAYHKLWVRLFRFKAHRDNVLKLIEMNSEIDEGAFVSKGKSNG